MTPAPTANAGSRGKMFLFLKEGLCSHPPPPVKTVAFLLPLLPLFGPSLGKHSLGCPLAEMQSVVAGYGRSLVMFLANRSDWEVVHLVQLVWVQEES